MAGLFQIQSNNVLWITRAMLGISFLDCKPNLEFDSARSQMWLSESQDLAKREDGWQTKSVTEWWLRNEKRYPGRLACWSDDIVKAAGRQ